MGIFGKNKNKEEDEPVQHIPKDRLAFYSSAVRKKESYDTKLVSLMPFDLNELEGLEGDKKWDRLKDLSVEYLKKNKELPSFAQEQDYERSGGASYQSFRELEKEAIELDNAGRDRERKPITVFNNAFDKIILPPGYRERIIEAVAQLKDEKKIFEEWGLGEKITKGRGINLLFSGESGTGKTYCGEIIAEYLGTKAEIVSVATIESKWVGESEQNVSSLFKALNGHNKVLVLDEVDSFLGSRQFNNDHQYQNKLTNQFLIELERHNGIVVMTTNRPVKLDRALQRRIDIVLDFPFPESEARKAIWQYLIPKKMPVKDLNYDKLSEEKLNGGQIKNVILSVARKAVNRDLNEIPMGLFEEAIVEELSEIKNLTEGKDHS